MDDDCPELVSAKVPVTILTGFLGSGKTTLLHNVLTEEHHLKIAVIVNEFEFGKSIEKGLTLRSSEKSEDEWVELSNGCMCCTAQDQAVLALEKLMMRKGSFDLILVETSGLADPAPIAANFWQDDALCALLYLSGIVAVVDAKNIRRYLTDSDVSNEVTRQLLLADRIVLNKTDLVPEDELTEVAASITELNHTAHQIRSSFCKLSHEQLRDILFVDTTNTTDMLATLPDHRHSTITSISIELPGAVTAAQQVDFLCRELLYHEGLPFEVVRCKAAIWCSASTSAPPLLLQLQSIGELFDVREMDGHSVPPGCNRFLILGRNLNKEWLESIIRKFLF